MLFLYQQNFVKKLSLLKCFLSTGTEGLYLYNFQHLMINLPIISLMKQLHMRLYLNHCSASIFNDSISKLFVPILLFVVIITYCVMSSVFELLNHTSKCSFTTGILTFEFFTPVTMLTCYLLSLLTKFWDLPLLWSFIIVTFSYDFLSLLLPQSLHAVLYSVSEFWD